VSLSSGARFVQLRPARQVVAPGGRIRDRFIGHRDDVDLERLGRLTTE
jgi:hypothetical protein